ncbi:hypothetical protein AB0392_14745 [Nonomuraea angiospora]
MAQTTDECITQVADIDRVGPQVVRQDNNSLPDERIAELEARFAEPTAD